MRAGRTLLARLAVGVFLLAGMQAEAAELLMYRRPGCVWCLRWDQEIAPAYAKTEAGRRAPVRMVDMMHDRTGGIRLAASVFFTPTFVLASKGREIGRIEGYAGQDLFWQMLHDQLAKLPKIKRPRPEPAEMPPSEH